MNIYFESHQLIFEHRLDYLNLKGLGAWLATELFTNVDQIFNGVSTKAN